MLYIQNIQIVIQDFLVNEVIENSKDNNTMYNLLGQAIRQPEGVYIQNGKVKFKID